MASNLYIEACKSGRALFEQLNNLSLHIAPESKIATFRGEYSIDSDLLRANVEGSVQSSLAGAGISVSNLRYVEVTSKGGRRKDKETAYNNHIDGRNGVILTADMFKASDKNSPDKQLWASEVIWQSWLYLAKTEKRHARCLRIIGQYFVTNAETKQIIWESLEHSATTRVGPVRGHVEYSPLDDGFHALLGSPNGKTMMRMLLDHKSHLGYKTVERIVLVGDETLELSGPEARTFLVALSNTRQSLSRIPVKVPKKILAKSIS